VLYLALPSAGVVSIFPKMPSFIGFIRIAIMGKRDVSPSSKHNEVSPNESDRKILSSGKAADIPTMDYHRSSVEERSESVTLLGIQAEQSPKLDTTKSTEVNLTAQLDTLSIKTKNEELLAKLDETMSKKSDLEERRRNLRALDTLLSEKKEAIDARKTHIEMKKNIFASKYLLIKAKLDKKAEALSLESKDLIERKGLIDEEEDNIETEKERLHSEEGKLHQRKEKLEEDQQVIESDQQKLDHEQNTEYQQLEQGRNYINSMRERFETQQRNIDSHYSSEDLADSSIMHSLSAQQETDRASYMEFYHAFMEAEAELDEKYKLRQEALDSRSKVNKESILLYEEDLEKYERDNSNLKEKEAQWETKLEEYNKDATKHLSERDLYQREEKQLLDEKGELDRESMDLNKENRQYQQEREDYNNLKAQWEEDNANFDVHHKKILTITPH